MLKWLREAMRLRSLQRGRQEHYRRLDEEVRIKRARKATTQELYQLGDGWNFEDHWSDEIEAIRTDRLLRKARRLSVPTPGWSEDSADWETSKYTYAPILSPAAGLRLRREITLELEVRQKPWLNWGVLVIAGLSLLVSIAALLVSLGKSDVSP
jgi:hypothetical protein